MSRPKSMREAMAHRQAYVMARARGCDASEADAFAQAISRMPNLNADGLLLLWLKGREYEERRGGGRRG